MAAHILKSVIKRFRPKALVMRILKSFGIIFSVFFLVFLLVQAVDSLFDLGLNDGSISGEPGTLGWRGFFLCLSGTFALCLAGFLLMRLRTKSINSKSPQKMPLIRPSASDTQFSDDDTKIDTFQSEEIIRRFEYFGDLTVKEILRKSEKFDFLTLEQLCQWERQNKNRKTLISELEKRIQVKRPRPVSVRARDTASTLKRRIPKSVKWSIAVFGIVVAVPLVIGMIYRLSVGCDPFKSQDICNARRDSVNQEKRASMPNLQGKILSEVDPFLEELKMGLTVNHYDLIASRSVWSDDNWTVVAQSPRPGSLLKYGASICIGIVKSDETWRTTQRLQCWNRVSDNVADSVELEFLSNDLVRVSRLPSSLVGRHLRATIKIEMDGGNTVSLPFCTYAPTSNQQVNLKIDAGDGGDPGVFSSGGESFKAGLFLNWNGRFRFELTKLEESSTGGCV